MPTCSAANPADNAPIGIAAQQPAWMRPKTRARIPAGTAQLDRPHDRVDRAGGEPGDCRHDQQPGQRQAERQGKIRRSAAKAKATTKVSRRGNRCPTAPNINEPINAPPPIVPTSRPKAMAPPSSRSAYTGSKTVLFAASKRLVTTTSSTSARSSGSRTVNLKPSASWLQ